MTEQRRGVAAAIGRRLRAGLVNLAWFSVFHPRTVLILILIGTVVAALGATRLELSTSVEELLPVNVKSAALIRSRSSARQPAC